MHIIMGVIAAISFLFGLVCLAGATSAIHEIQAGIAFLIFAVSLGSAGIIHSIKKLVKVEKVTEEKIPVTEAKPVSVERTPPPKKKKYLKYKDLKKESKQ